MQTRDFSITLDMIQPLPFRPFEVTDGDTGNLLHVTLLSNGEPLLLNDCAVVLVFASSTGFAMQDGTSGVTIGEEAGTFTVLLDPAGYGPGNVSADVQVYSGPGNKVLITSTRFDFRCRYSLISEEIVRASASYPPLVAATREASLAAAAATAAAERIGRDIGEMNVQADWAETDTAKDSYILHKPFIPETAGDVFAAPETHASRHGASGADPVTPAGIGAEPKRLQFVDVSVAASAFTADTTYEDYPYRATVALTGVTADMTPEVVLGLQEAVSGNFAPVVGCCPGGLWLYAAEVPETDMVIPTIYCLRHTDGGAADGGTVTGITSETIARIWTGTQAAYDALTPSADTLYFVEG